MATSTVNAIIPAGASLSNAVNTSAANVRLQAITLAPAWTSAWLTVQVSADGLTWTQLHTRDGKPYVIDFVPSASVLFDPDMANQIPHFRLCSSTASGAVPQLQERIFKCLIDQGPTVE